MNAWKADESASSFVHRWYELSFDDRKSDNYSDSPWKHTEKLDCHDNNLQV